MPSDDSLVNTTKKAMEKIHLVFKLDALISDLITQPQFAGTHFKHALIGERSPAFRATVLVLAEACQAQLKALSATSDLTISDLISIAEKLARHKEDASQLAARALAFGLQIRVQSWLEIAKDAREAEQRDRDSEEHLRLRFQFIAEAYQREIQTIEHMLAIKQPANDNMHPLSA